MSVIKPSEDELTKVQADVKHEYLNTNLYKQNLELNRIEQRHKKMMDYKEKSYIEKRGI